MDALINSIVNQSPLYFALSKPKSLKRKQVKPFNYNDPLPVNVLVSTLQGKRNYMEDTYCIHELPGISYYAVFDGHGGDKVSTKLRDNFFNYLIQELRTLSDINDSQAVQDTLQRSFVNFDHHLCLDHENESIGSTGIILLKIRNRVYIANLGDSRAVVYGPSGYFLETQDHKPDREKERIENVGGSVMLGRVNGQLAVSRAFGDFYLKRGQNGYLGINSPVCPLPDIYTFDLNETGQVIAVLGSDGVWDKISSLEITKIKPDRRFCDKIVSMAFQRNSNDNITVLAIKLFP